MAQSKQDVLDLVSAQFSLPAHFGKNFDALYDCLTDPVYKSGPQVGFIVVLEHIPANVKFDKEAREQLLDIFRDAADYWGDRKIVAHQMAIRHGDHRRELCVQGPHNQAVQGSQERPKVRETHGSIDRHTGR